MTSRLTPHLHFHGTAREAMGFYAGIFGGDVDFHTFAEIGCGQASEADADRIAHASLETDAGYAIMACDAPSEHHSAPVTGASMCLNGDDAALLRGYFEKLSAGGTVDMPLAEQAWGDEFGACVDKFGVPWMVNISRPA
ncbi:MAG TPA: VOC family protein [Mycobacterium sp.]